MKQIRLEFPICWGDDSRIYMPSQIYLKIVGNQTEAFFDKELTQAAPKTEKKISFEVEAPEELELINVVQPGGTTPIGNIGLNWDWYGGADPEWKIPGLKKVLVIVDDNKHEVPVINEKPDFYEWKKFNGIDGQGRWWFMKPWALTVYFTETKTFGGLYWHSKLATLKYP